MFLQWNFYHTSLSLLFFLARIILQQNTWITHQSMLHLMWIFNSASVAWWKLCFPFHLNLVSQNTGSSPLCGLLGTTDRLVKMNSHWMEIPLNMKYNPMHSYTKLTMGFISPKEITMAEIQKWKTRSMICYIIACCVIASNITLSESL